MPALAALFLAGAAYLLLRQRYDYGAYKLLLTAWWAVTGLAVLALCLVAALACLLVPVLDAEVPEHVVEAAALVLLGTAGAIGLAQATDLIQVVVGLETLALSAVTLVALGTGDKALVAAFKY